MALAIMKRAEKGPLVHSIDYGKYEDGILHFR